MSKFQKIIGTQPAVDPNDLPLRAVTALERIAHQLEELVDVVGGLDDSLIDILNVITEERR